MDTRGILILGTGLAGVGKTTHLKALAELIPDSLYLGKDDINLELGQGFDASSDYYKRTISSLTYRLMMERANSVLAEGKVVICDGYFGDKLTSTPILEQFQNGKCLVKVIYFHCSGNKQQWRLEKRGSERDRDKEGSRFAPYRKQHLENHVRELSQIPYQVIDAENDSDLSTNVQTILKYLACESMQDYCFISRPCQLSIDESMLETAQFTKILDRHKKEIRSQKEETQVVLFSKVVIEKKPIKKVIVLDAGGVLQPDAEFGASNQTVLSKLTNLSESELNENQDHHSFNGGERSLSEGLIDLSQRARIDIKPSVDQLLQAYKQGIPFYPGAPEMIRELYKAGYQVVLLTNNSDLGLVHTRELLAAEGLSCVKVYGSAELHLHKPDLRIFLHVCKEEQVSPEECWFVDDREKNRQAAQSLGMSVIAFDRPAQLDQAAKAINACRDEFLRIGILSENNCVFPPKFNRGKYPSLFGVIDNKVVRYEPSERSYIEVDESNEDGNQRKRCLYESRLSQLVVEHGRQYWGSAYHEINQLFLADFHLKSDSKRVQTYKAYFDKIGSVLKKEGLIEDKQSYDVKDLRAALIKLFDNDFNLTNVSQFYYNVWLFNYGPEPLEPFVFLTDLLRENHSISNDSSRQDEQIRILKLFPDMAHSAEDRRQAYYIAQPWLTCGVPQLRGRQARANAPKPAEAKTLGIIRDDDPLAADFSSPPHFAAKTLFSPSREHPIVKEFQAKAAPIVGGSSGTLGRNVFMLAPLVQSGLLSQDQLMNYVMGFLADLIYRGHHSYEEVAVVAEQVLFPLKPWFDSLRDPIHFYEQLLTSELLASDIYRKFSTAHENFFNRPITQMKQPVSKMKSNPEETKSDVREKEKPLQDCSWSWGKKALLAGVGFGALFVGYSIFVRGTGVSSSSTSSTPNLTLWPKLLR